MSTANAANNQWLGYEEDMHATCPTVGAIDVLQALVPGNGATISNLALRGGVSTCFAAAGLQSVTPSRS